MDFYTVEQKIMNNIYQGNIELCADIRIAIMDECGFSWHQANFIYEKINNILDDSNLSKVIEIKKLAYILREFINLEEV